MLLAKLREKCQENFDSELEARKVKIRTCHVSRALVPEQFARFPGNFEQSFTKYCCTKGCLLFL